MTFRVREMGPRSHRSREIELSLRVYAGVATDQLHTAMTPHKFAMALEAIQRQITTTWHRFELPREEWYGRRSRRPRWRHIDYSFRFRIEAAPLLPFVDSWTSTGERINQDHRDGTRSIANAFTTANAEGFDNIAVVHPRASRPCAPRLDAGGHFEHGGTRADQAHPDSFIQTSTMIRLSFEHLIVAGNLTAAHETGHLLGLPDGVYDHHTIMKSLNEPGRYMTERDMIRVHHSVELQNGLATGTGRARRR